MKASTRTVMIGWLAIGLLGARHVHAASLRTGSMQPGDGQKLVCTVLNVQVKPLGMQAVIVDRFGANKTDFAATDYDESGTIVTTLRVESTSRDARYCRILVVGGKKHDVAGSLQACTYDNSACGGAIVAR
jgi:hypothetical protein